MNTYEQTHEVLERIVKLMDRILVRTELDDEIHRFALEAQNMADGVLSLSPRNCDVGTAEEQAQRMANFCKQLYSKAIPGRHICSACKFHNQDVGWECYFDWAQMPYEEGGAK